MDGPIFAKVVVMREGSSLRNSADLEATFVYDACELLGIAEPNDQLNEWAEIAWSSESTVDAAEEAWSVLRDCRENAEDRRALPARRCLGRGLLARHSALKVRIQVT
jgi:hypothetical protein